MKKDTTLNYKRIHSPRSHSNPKCVCTKQRCQNINIEHKTNRAGRKKIDKPTIKVEGCISIINRSSRQKISKIWA